MKRKEKYQDTSTFHFYIAHIGGNHIVAIVDGKVNDIWDSTNGVLGIIGLRGKKNYD